MHTKIPQNLKHKKFCKRFIFSKGSFNSNTMFNIKTHCALVALEPGILTLKQLQTCLLLLNKTLKSYKRTKTKYFCTVIIRAPLTEKSLGSRMGRGKGSISKWICVIPKGRILFHFRNLKNPKLACMALRMLAYKLPILTKIIFKRSFLAKHFDYNLRKYLKKRKLKRC